MGLIGLSLVYMTLERKESSAEIRPLSVYGKDVGGRRGNRLFTLDSSFAVTSMGVGSRAVYQAVQDALIVLGRYPFFDILR